MLGRAFIPQRNPAHTLQRSEWTQMPTLRDNGRDGESRPAKQTSARELRIRNQAYGLKIDTAKQEDMARVNRRSLSIGHPQTGGEPCPNLPVLKIRLLLR